jgi:tRNA U34 5-methylaminomethyl-2-thiouridine-forming methyltransferase MnmC
MSIQIISSGDGSHTLFVPSLNETYHSHKGALTESRHVFIKEGFDQMADLSSALKILEVGFGTGLNAILTLMRAEETGKPVIYHTLEPFPLPEEIIENLNYSELLPAHHRLNFEKLHTCSWNEEVQLTPHFRLKKIRTTLQDVLSELRFNIIYFDAFAPNKQPEVWEPGNLKKCFDLLEAGGILTTYCAQGQFKRNLKDAGFAVQTLEGPPGKKEMTRGIKE